MVTTIREHHPIEKVSSLTVLTKSAGLGWSLTLLLHWQACTSYEGCEGTAHQAACDLRDVCHAVMVCWSVAKPAGTLCCRSAQHLSINACADCLSNLALIVAGVCH